ncbi:hypothetical protein GCM10023350_19720 [Nocardioides endophyticus]|uniref:DUF4279 domain-containing protein n=1 Tax=Nocardioides endophyticus TaxID=1353775 RepID=A0ABP8YQJ4_9ACTN
MSDSPWKVQQYCYFWLASEALTAEQVTEHLGIEPDRTSVMGSRRTSPRVVPAAHRWEIQCETHGRIGEQASTVLARIAPAAGRVRDLVDRGDVAAGLMMVRWFDDPKGGYNAMGWWMSAEQIQLLASMGATVESDEYPGDFTAHSPL